MSYVLPDFYKTLSSLIGEKATNIIGQIRIYSLIDLVLFAYAFRASVTEIFGIVLIHVSFLFYLEYTHKHSYRLLISKYVWIVIGIAGVILFPKWAVLGYVLGSMLYVRKNQVPFSYFSPFSRGLQQYFMAAGIVGFMSPLALLSFVLLAVRNFVGDLRDTIKDRSENMMTLPVVFGLKKDYKMIHFVVLLLTSGVWWYISDLPILWLIAIYTVQWVTYNITPR